MRHIKRQKYLVTFFYVLILLSFSTSVFTYYPDDQIPDTKLEFNPEMAFEHIRLLSTEYGARISGSENEIKAGRYIYEQFIELELTVLIQEFEFSHKGQKIRTRNILGICPGSTPEIIVVSAHYDSVDVPGADDNASGVGTLLELAKIFSKNFHQRTIVFAAFSGEEQGSFGSEFFVDNFYQIKNVIANINLDMVGYKKGTLNFIVIGDQGSEFTPLWLAKRAMAAGKKLGFNPKISAKEQIFLRPLLGYEIAEHASFLKKNIAAITVADFSPIDESSPVWHSEEDTIDNIGIDMLKKSGLTSELLIKSIDVFGADLGDFGDQDLYLFLDYYMLSPYAIVSLIILFFLVLSFEASAKFPKSSKSIRQLYFPVKTLMAISFFLICALLFFLIISKEASFYTLISDNFLIKMTFLLISIIVVMPVIFATRKITQNLSEAIEEEIEILTFFQCLYSFSLLLLSFGFLLCCMISHPVAALSWFIIPCLVWPLITPNSESKDRWYLNFIFLLLSLSLVFIILLLAIAIFDLTSITAWYRIGVPAIPSLAAFNCKALSIFYQRRIKKYIHKWE